MGTTNRIDNFKDFSPELQIIKFVDSLESVDTYISKENIFSTKAKISKKDKNISLEINNGDLSSIPDDTINNVKILINEKEFFIDSFRVNSTNTNVNVSGVSFSAICTWSIFRNKPFLDNFESIFRCYIPTELSRLQTFNYQFETVTYQDKQTDYFYNCIRFNIDNILFDLIQLKSETKGYFIIESLHKVGFEDFCAYCYSIKQALGFISGYMPGGEEFYFSSSLDFYYVNSHRPSISSMFYPIDTNPYSIGKEDIAKLYVNKLNVIPSTVFSELITKIHNNLEFSSSIILMLEAMSIHSLLIIPSIFAVIVEVLSKLISKKDTGLVLPIKDPKLSKRLIEELNLIVDSYSEQIDKNGIVKIKRRINEINRPINKEKLTNNEKLTLPFEQLNLTLTIEDVNIIEHRNDLLHGNIFLSDDPHKDLNVINNYMFYVSSKLYTLISSLILKYVSYNGYIINHAKFYEESCNMNTNEEYYKLI